MRYEDAYIDMEVIITNVLKEHEWLEISRHSQFLNKKGVVIDKSICKTNSGNVKLLKIKLDNTNFFYDYWFNVESVEPFDENKFFNKKKITDEI